jgi:hypothetical protein
MSNEEIDELSLPDWVAEEAADNIRTGSWTAINVTGPTSYWFTVGNHASGLPELLIMGDDPDNELEMVCERMREQDRPFDDGEFVDVGGRYLLKLIDTSDENLQQILVADGQGRYPGDPGCKSVSSPVTVWDGRKYNG